MSLLYINGFLDAVTTMLSAYSSSDHLSAVVECLADTAPEPNSAQLLAIVVQQLQEKHEARSTYAARDSKYYYAQKPAAWQKALQAVEVVACTRAHFQAQLNQFFDNRQPNSPAAALSQRFLELLQQVAADNEMQYFELLHTPFPISLQHNDLIDASREFILTAKDAGVLYIAIGLMRQ
jgi:hypothetical protein